MRFLFLVIFSGAQLFASYGNVRSITIDHTKVPNTDQSYFPVLISGTYTYLETVANGGAIQHTDGSGNATDLIFTSDSTCNILLPFEIESYSASTGVIVYWVRVPTVSHTADTVIYMCYGNAAVTVTQAQPRAVWANGFQTVQHMAGNSTDSLGDHTGSDTSVTYNTSNGQIGQGAGLNGSSSFIADGSLQRGVTGTPITVSAWVKGTSFANAYNSVEGFEDGSTGHTLLIKSTGKLAIYLSGGGGTNYDGTGSNTLSTGTWYYLAYTYSSGFTLTGYVNGSSDKTATGSAAYGVPADTQYIGKSHFGSRFLNGNVDEFRISNVARSGDWLTTEYNNQNSPSTFYTVGSASAPTALTFTFHRAVTIDRSKVPSTQTNFPVLYTGTFAYLATVANGGAVQNSNGYDIVFAADSTCSNGLLAFEIETYAATDGTINAWVNIPTLSSSVDTIYYVCYGNSGISSSQENKALTWNSHYKGVWHLKDGTSLDLTDSTIYGDSGTNHSTAAAAGIVDGSLTATQASSQYVDLGNSLNVEINAATNNAANPLTIEAWAYFTGTFTNGVNPRVLSNFNAAATRGWEINLSANDATVANWFYCQSNNGGLVSTLNTHGAISKNTWYYVLCAMGSDLRMYVNAAATGTNPATPIFNDGANNVNIGRWPGSPTNSYWDGRIDEVRIADTAWSADWVTTNYNIVGNFSTCCTVGSPSSGAHGFASVQ